MDNREAVKIGDWERTEATNEVKPKVNKENACGATVREGWTN